MNHDGSLQQNKKQKPCDLAKKVAEKKTMT